MCPGLGRFKPGPRAEYLKAVGKAFETRERPMRVSSCVHVLNTIDVCQFPTLNHNLHELLPVQLVTSQVVYPTHPVLSHMRMVHGDTAFNQLNVSAQHSHTCIEVAPEDTRVCLSQVARAINAAALSTTVTVAIPRKHALRALWLPYLKLYTVVKSEIRVISPSHSVRVDIWSRVPGHKQPNSAFVDPVRLPDTPMLSATNPIHSIYSTVNIEFPNFCAKTLLDTGAAVCVVTKSMANSLHLVTSKSDLHSLQGVSGQPVQVHGVTNIPINLNSHISVPAVAYVVDSLPIGTDLILGQSFLRTYQCAIRFGFKQLFFEICYGNQVFKISRPYSETACQFPHSVNLISASQLKSVPDQCIFKAYVSMIQRDFKVQEDVHPLLRKVLDKYPSVMSGNPPDGSISRDAYCTIDLMPGSTPKMLRSYRLTPLERTELDAQVAKMLEKHWIRPSSSPWASPVLFVHKSDGGLRMCVDFRKLNAQTIPINYPMPHPQESLDSFAGAKIFSTLDLVSGFHQISIMESDRYKTAFRGTKGLYEYTVMPLGLVNAPAIFQRAMHAALGPLCGPGGCCVVYLDDIIIFSKTLEEHQRHLDSVLAALDVHHYSCSPKKCTFGLSSVPYLGHIVSADGLSPDPAKISIISEWPAPTNLTELRSFIGLIQYCRRFIPNLSKILVPLTKLTSKDVPFVWSTDCQSAFAQLKVLISTAPTLAMPDPNLPFQVYSDASIDGTGGILMQNGRVVAYTGHKFSDVERRWTTTDQELYALVSNFDTWRCYLEGRTDTELFTDHQPLVWLCSQPNLSRKQTRWVLFLQRFQFTLKYVPGKVNPADPLSRAPHLKLPPPFHDTSFETYDPIISNVVAATAPVPRVTRAAAKRARFSTCDDVRSEVVVPNAMPSPPLRTLPPPPPLHLPQKISISDLAKLRTLARSGFADMHAHGDGTFASSDAVADADAALPTVPAIPSLCEQSSIQNHKILCFDNFLEAVKRGYVADPTFAALQPKLTQVGPFWFKEHALALPNFENVRKLAMFQMHDAPWSAHVGRARTLTVLRSVYWWPDLDSDVRTYVASCDSCQRNKAHHAISENLLAPLPVPERPFQIIGVDFITQLPTSTDGFDAVCVIVCHFTKLAHFIPCHTAISAKEFAVLFRTHFWKHHGCPMHIVSDRGPQFVAGFWRQVCQDLGIQLRLTSSYQPSTDGQVERTNKVLEEAIRAYVNSLHTNWSQWIDCIEFAHNKATVASHGMSPFSLVYHHEPMSPPELALFQGLPLRTRCNDVNPVVPTLKTRAGRKHCVSWVTRFSTARQLLQQAKDHMSDIANKRRVERVFSVGDYVMLNAKFYRLKKPARSEKFLPRFCGPFKITARVGSSAYKLALPPSCKIHPVVHVSKLWAFKSRSDTSQLPSPVLLDSADSFEVLDILSHRGSPRTRQYLVQWKGKDILYNTWEPYSSLMSCSHLVRNYEENLTQRGVHSAL